MDRRGRKAKRETSAKPDAEMTAHWQMLGLRSIDEYKQWCARSGFNTRTTKSRHQRRAELDYAFRATAESRLAKKKREARRPDELIERMIRGQVPPALINQPQLAALSRACESARYCKATKKALERLLRNVFSRADLFRAGPAFNEYGHRAGNSYVEALVAVARDYREWIRPIEDWKPETHNSRRQFSSLVRHLFARWKVPRFMDSVWFQGPTEAALRQQSWFRLLARGENIRTADLPIAYSTRMAHHFMRAPDHLSVDRALRWGQLRAMGSNERLAHAVVKTKLGTNFEHDEFWKTVFAWLISHPWFDAAQIGPVIDFIEHQKFVTQVVYRGAGHFERRKPPQPNFSINGRTPESLMRQVDEWHRELAKPKQPQRAWEPSDITPFEFVEGSAECGNLKTWTLRELLNSDALVQEGREMRHCVAMYSTVCAARACSIWTLDVESPTGTRKELTVEVNHSTRVICQARGKCNAMPSEKQRSILRRWAAKAGACAWRTTSKMRLQR